MLVLPEKLAREIARVTELRSRYQALEGLPQVNVAPALMLMDAALEQAKRAAGSPDIEGQMRALAGLGGFTE
jgi:hypothetical protein